MNHIFRRSLAVIVALTMLPVAASTAVAQEGATSTLKTPYYQGRTRLALNGGYISSGSDDRFLIAASFGVFVIDNLEAGLDTQIQFGSPFIGQLGPAIRYIYPVTRELHPYFGGFYRHWFVGSNIDDIDTVGVRGGLMIDAGQVFFQIGAVYEATISECSGDGCNDFYPELGISLLL
ncbi:MAG: hypothetical protein ACI9MR_000692 [Myxococcota bacterium]|jgi:hypothetical protein